MDFDTIFFISFFFVSFYYPIFIYPINPEITWIYKYYTDEATISKASALSLIGIVSYMLGSVRFKNKIKEQITSKYHPIKTTGLFLTSLVSLVLYILLGGYSALRNTYITGTRDTGGLYAYFSIIVYICIFSMISIWFMNSYHISKTRLQIKCFPPIQVIYIIIYILLLIFAGSRGKVLNIILLSMGIYAYLYRPFSLRKVLLYSLLGMLLMFAVMIYRSGGEYYAGSLGDIAIDLIITNHNTYEGISIVDEYGLSYGKTMLSYVIGIIPLLQNIFFNITGIDPDTANSAMVITQSTLGTTEGAGTGTTVIADIYIAFGMIGVVFFMGGLGHFIQKILVNAKQNIYCLAIYGILMGMSVYLARAEFFYPAKTIVWGCILIFLCSHVGIKGNRRIVVI